MAESDLLIGLDVGTSALKAVAVTAQGELIAQVSESYPLYTPLPGWTEQDPEDWAKAACTALERLTSDPKLTGRKVAALSLSGQMHGTVFLDAAGKVIRPALLWNDQRTQKQCRQIQDAFGGVEPLVAATGNLALTGFSAPKILWLRENEPQAFDRTAKILLPKDYVRYRLTGQMTTEVSDASGTLLLDVKKRNWSDRTLDLLDLDRSLLPEVVESIEVAGEVTTEVAGQTGLPAGTPVVAGAGDQAAGAVGTGNVAPGTVTIAIGTSGVVFATSDSYLADPQGRLHAFCHASPGLWHTMGVMLSAGGSLQWLRGVLSTEGSIVSYSELVAAARLVPTGSEGLLFHPYLCGERTPINDPQAKGLFFGLTQRHGRGHLVRAVMEGVVYGILDCYRLMEQRGMPIKNILMTGGAAKEDLWCQLVADAVGLPVRTVRIDEGPAFGAALLAGVGVGLFKDVASACRAAVRIDRTYEPDPDHHRLLESGLIKYKKLYKAVKSYYQD